MHHRAHLEIKIVSTPEEQLQAFAVRALVYMGEQNCPWAEEFDCNDYTATQVLGTIDGEPVVTARIRWFGTFAKLERLAVRAQYRGAGYGCALLEFLIDLCREKGFAQVYLHAQTRLQRFYEKSGFRRVGKPFCFFRPHLCRDARCDRPEAAGRCARARPARYQPGRRRLERGGGAREVGKSLTCAPQAVQRPKQVALTRCLLSLKGKPIAHPGLF